MEMINRPRRLRKNPIIRGMVRETRASKDGLIYPIFFEEGSDIKAPIDSLDGLRDRRQHTATGKPRSFFCTASTFGRSRRFTAFRGERL